jgi:LacI family transcriptional regulator
MTGRKMLMKANKKNNEAAPYQLIYEQMRNAIRGGELNGKLPSIAELTQKFSVSHNTIKKVLDKLKEQQYLYGMHGKGVYVNDTVTSNPAFQKNIVFYLHIDSYRNPFYLQALSKLRQLLETGQANVHFVNSPRQLSEMSGIVDVLLAVDVKKESELEVIKSLIGQEKIIIFNQNFSGWHCVGTDNFRAGYIAMDYLYGKGHRQIGLLSRDLDIPGCFFDLRYQGACLFASEHPGMTIFNSESEISESRMDEVSASLAAKNLFEQTDELTAVFAFTDILALGFVSYCHEAGISIPGDISLLGFDNRDFSTMLLPPLTTFQENSEELSRMAMLEISNVVSGKSNSIKQIWVEPFVVERESVINIKKKSY